MNTRSFSGSILLLVALAMVIAGCKSGPPTASEGATKYEIRGKVVAADKSKLEVTIAHEAIPGYMEAMTMPLKLYDEWVYDELKNGAQIQATLVVDGEKTWLENPIVTTVADPSLINRKEESGVEPSVGAALPDFSLVNQDGKKISTGSYRGRILVTTFIYTRCPLPDYCPLMSRNFAELEKKVRQSAELGPKTTLLSITVDPEYDTPEVLRKYAANYRPEDLKGDFSNWEFATGTPEQIRAVAGFFGLNYWPENNQIIHGLRTAIITPDGKVYRTYRGNDWTPDQVFEDLGRLIRR